MEYLSLAILLLVACLYALTPLIFHEMGHWVVLKRYGVPVQEYWLGLGPAFMHLKKLRVGMLPIGGAVVPEPDKYATLSDKQKFWVAAGGPLASVIYGVAAMGLYLALAHTPGAEILRSIALLNFVLAGINALPIPPLDGFQVLAHWRASKGNPIPPTVLGYAHRVGNGLVYGIGFMILGSVLLA